MATLGSVAGVEQYAARLYSGDKAATAEFAAKGWAGVTGEAGLHTLTAVLGQSPSVQAIVFACRAVTESLERLFQSGEELQAFLVALLDSTAGRRAHLAPAGLDAMCRLASTALKRGYRHSAPVQQLVPQLAQAVAAAADGSPAQAVIAEVACHVLAGLVEAMAERRLSHVAEDVSSAQHFRGADLLAIFSAGALAAKRARPGDAALLRAALALLSRALHFDFACALAAGGCGEGPETPPSVFPAAWNAALTDKALLDRLWALFQLKASGQAALPARSILDTLAILTGLKAPSFAVPGSSPALCAEARRRWLHAALLQTHVSMERGSHLGEAATEEVLLAFTVVLGRVKPSCTIDELLANDTFGGWLESVHRFTARCFALAASTDTAAVGLAVSELLRVWWGLCGAATWYATGDAAFIVTHTSEVLAAYLEHCAAGRAEWFAAGATAAISGGHGDFAASSYPLDDDAGGAAEELGLAVSVAGCCGADGWRLLAGFVNGRFGRFERAGPGAASVIAGVEGAAWALHTAAACLDDSGCCAAGGKPLGSLLVEAFLMVHRSVGGGEADAGTTDALAGFPSAAVRGHFEGAAVAFLSAAARQVVVNRAAARSGPAFADALAGRLVQARLMTQGTDVAVFLLDLAARKVWGVLAAGNVGDGSRAQALALLRYLTDTPAAAKVLRETPAHRRWFASLRHDALPPSLAPAPGAAYSADRCRARYQYVRCIAQVCLSASRGAAQAEGGDGESPPPELAELLAYLVPALETATAQAAVAAAVDNSGGLPTEDSAALIALLVDLRGVLTCAARRQYRPIARLVQSQLPGLLAGVMRPACVGDAAGIHVLRLLEELASNRGQRIFYGANSAEGYTLFRGISAGLTAAASVIAGAFAAAARGRPAFATDAGGGDDDDDAEDWAWAAVEPLLRTARAALHGGYCNLAVFQLYGDPALEGLVRAAWGLTAGLPFAELAVRPAAVEAAVGFVNALCDGFFAWAWLGAEPAAVRQVWGLLEAAAFPADAALLPAQPQALEALGRLMGCCHGGEAGRRLRWHLAAADGAAFKRLVSTCLEWSMAPAARAAAATASIGAPSGGQQQLLIGVLCPLLHIVVDGDELAVVRDFFVTRCKTQAAAAALDAAFAGVRDAYASAPATASSQPQREAAAALIASIRSHF